MKQQYSSGAGKAIKTRFALFIWKEKLYVMYKINRFLTEMKAKTGDLLRQTRE